MYLCMYVFIHLFIYLFIIYLFICFYVCICVAGERLLCKQVMGSQGPLGGFCAGGDGHSVQPRRGLQNGFDFIVLVEITCQLLVSLVVLICFAISG